MACKDCYTGYSEIIPDRRVQYTGDDIPLLGICSGDFISDVEEIIIDKLISTLDGTGVQISSLTLGCDYTKSLVTSSDRSVSMLIQKLFDSQCTLKQLIDSLSSTIGQSYSFNTSCLTLGANPTRDDILQAAINKLCTVEDRVDAIEGDYVKASELEQLVTEIVNNDGTTTVIQYSSRLFPNVAVAYFGSLSFFDNTGKGLSSAGFDKVYICNGLNGTPDLRGRVIVGAVRNVPGGPLDSAVDPMNPINPNTNYSIGDKFGSNYHKLTVDEIPSHTHSVNDPGHQHDLSSKIQFDGANSGGESGSDEKETPRPKKTEIALSNITLGNTGGSQYHENRQPSAVGVWIMYIPS